MSCGQKCLTLFAHFLFLDLRTKWNKVDSDIMRTPIHPCYKENESFPAAAVPICLQNTGIMKKQVSPIQIFIQFPSYTFYPTQLPPYLNTKSCVANKYKVYLPCVITHRGFSSIFIFNLQHKSISFKKSDGVRLKY